MEGLNLKTAKLAMEADGNIIGDCFIVQPEKDLAKKLGVLFGIVEIYNINDTFIDGFLEAINDLKTEYYLPPYNSEKSVEKRFEEALSRANRRIQNTINQSIEEVDLRNVSAVLGIIFNNTVYISSTGRIKGLFSRRKKNLELMIFDILASSQEKKFKPETEKIFANILSGELSEKDALLFINEEFLGLFSQNDLAETTLSNPVEEAVKFIEGSIKEKVAKKNFYAIAIRPDNIIAESPLESEALVIPKNKSESINDLDAQKTQATHLSTQKKSPQSINRPVNHSNEQINQELKNKVGQAVTKNIKPQQSIDKLIYTQVKTEKYLTPSLMPNWQKFLIIFWSGLKKYTSKTINYTKKISLELFSWTKNLINKQTNKSNPAKPKEISGYNNYSEKQFPETITLEDDLSQKESITETSDYQDINEFLSEDNSIIEDESPDTETTTIHSNEIIDKSSLTLTEKINGGINGLVIRFLELKRLQQIAVVGSLILLFIFSQSIVMMGRSYDKSTGNGSGYDQIAKKIEEQLNIAEAQNIFNDEIGALAAIKQAKDLLSQIPTKRSTNSLKQQLSDKINATGYSLQHINYQDNPKILADFNKSLTYPDLIGLARTGKVFWAFDNSERNLLRLDSLTDKLEIRTSSLQAIKKISAIDDKNLILLAKSGEYYKYDINKNTATKINKPTKEYFSIKNPTKASPLLDPPLASSTIDMSAEIDTYSWFLDGQLGKLIVFDKAGTLKRQYASDQFISSTAFNALMKEKRAWIFKMGKIYQIDIDF